MKLPWLTEAQKFAIGGIIAWLCFAIVFAILLSGCASSIFDAPPEEAHEYLHHASQQNVLCQYAHTEHGRTSVWRMNVPRNRCENWTPI